MQPDNRSPKLSLLSFGAGAIGTYIGGSLALHGHKVVFMDQPSVVADLNQRGLKLEIGDQVFTIPDPHLADSIESALARGPYDACIFALKSYDTLPAVNAIIPYRNSFPPVLCLQNGVDNESIIAEILGVQNVIPGTVTSAIGRKSAGDIILERQRGVGIAKTLPISSKLAAALQDCGIKCQLYADAAAMKWSKLITNLPVNASSAILNLSPTEILADPNLFQIEIAQLREALNVLRALKHPVVDLPGTPVRLLAIAARWLPLWLAQPMLKRKIGGGRGGKMPSFHIDLYSRRGRSEVVFLNGAVVKYGQECGVGTPVNRFLTDTLMALTSGELPLEEYAGRPEKLIEQFNRIK